LKHVIFRDSWFQRLNPETMKELKTKWEKTLKAVREVPLPEDLDFIRRMVETGINVLDGKAKVSDFLALFNSYSKLWLAERKPEGLERIVERFWGAAGKVDQKFN